jgi:hypothetical protein
MTAAECLRFEQEAFGALHQMLGDLDAAAKAAAWAEVAQGRCHSAGKWETCRTAHRQKPVRQPDWISAAWRTRAAAMLRRSAGGAGAKGGGVIEKCTHHAILIGSRPAKRPIRSA